MTANKSQFTGIMKQISYKKVGMMEVKQSQQISGVIPKVGMSGNENGNGNEVGTSENETRKRPYFSTLPFPLGGNAIPTGSIFPLSLSPLGGEWEWNGNITGSVFDFLPEPHRYRLIIYRGQRPKETERFRQWGRAAYGKRGRMR